MLPLSPGQAEAMPFGMPGVVPSMAQLSSMDGAQMMMAQASGLMPGFAPPPTSSQGEQHDLQAAPLDADACIVATGLI